MACQSVQSLVKPKGLAGAKEISPLSRIFLEGKKGF
jgi:hypothetical protein